MNIELNGHKITLGPKALAFIETNMRGMGEVYCRDQLALWLTGGKVDADVTITGPARFVAVGNEIGIPKAGAEARERGSVPTGSTEPLPVASAAPAEAAPNGVPIEPYGAMPAKGDLVFACYDDGRPAPDDFGRPDTVVGGCDGKAITATGKRFELEWFKRPHPFTRLRNYVCRRSTKTTDEYQRQLERQAPADLYEPVGTMPVVGDVVEHIKDGGRHTITVVFAVRSPKELWRASYGYHKDPTMWQPKGAPCWRILKRQAPDAGLQVWQYGTSRYIVKPDSTVVYIVKPDSTVVRSLRGAVWFRSNNKWTKADGSVSTRITGPEAAKAIAEAKKQGVI